MTGTRSGKLPGKTTYAGRRRSMTRTSGFKVHSDTSGGEFHRLDVPTLRIKSGEPLGITFKIRDHSAGDMVGYGLWYWCSQSAQLLITGGPAKRTQTGFGPKSWNKIGSIWVAPSAAALDIKVIIGAAKVCDVALYAPSCGRLEHDHLSNARPALLTNMYQIAPEALFIKEPSSSKVLIDRTAVQDAGSHALVIKSCNRCGRYLPINVAEERDHLSFSNHCVAAHRRPCKHSTFGHLKNQKSSAEILILDYGFQLECRFCKKFEVNAAHNPQRTSSQMKEDGARRRAFELLLERLYQGTPQLRYRQVHGTELADDVWQRYHKKCFKCGEALATAKKMHLDHTRPLALLWPLDGTATALCGSCNSAKRDRPPDEFYIRKELALLAALTGVRLQDLKNVRVNEEALDKLLDDLDWLFDDFLSSPEMTKVRDGKVAGELVVKALDKVIARSSKRRRVKLQEEYDRRRQP